jgi:flagellar L-ring protein precursor FlgH
MINRFLTAALLLLPLSGCGTFQKLAAIGNPPAMTPTADPTLDPSWRKVSMPMPTPEPTPTESASLWNPGSREFFKDQRASKVGDIITVVVNIADQAQFNDDTTATRTGSENMGMPNMFGLESQIPKILSSATNVANMVSTNSKNSNVAQGQIQRNESVTLRLAGVVTQVLPNGDLVVAARQEVRVNSELRELRVSGVVRVADIASDNTISHDRMAEARISYGGKGTLTNLQDPRYGQQALDILLPF